MIELSTTEKGDKTRTYSAQSFLFCRHCSHVKHFLRADLLWQERGEIQFLEVFLLNVAVLPWALQSFLSNVIFLFNCIQLLLKLWLSYLFLSFLHFFFLTLFNLWRPSLPCTFVFFDDDEDEDDDDADDEDEDEDFDLVQSLATITTLYICLFSAFLWLASCHKHILTICFQLTLLILMQMMSVYQIRQNIRGKAM